MYELGFYDNSPYMDIGVQCWGAQFWTLVLEILNVGQYCHVCHLMSPTNKVYTTPPQTMDINLIDM